MFIFYVVDVLGHNLRVFNFHVYGHKLVPLEKLEIQLEPKLRS